MTPLAGPRIGTHIAACSCGQGIRAATRGDLHSAAEKHLKDAAPGGGHTIDAGISDEQAKLVPAYAEWSTR